MAQIMVTQPDMAQIMVKMSIVVDCLACPDLVCRKSADILLLASSEFCVYGRELVRCGE